MEVLLSVLLVLSTAAYYMMLKARKLKDVVVYMLGGMFFSLGGAYFSYYFTDYNIVSVLFTAMALFGVFVGSIRLLLKATSMVK